MSIQDRLMQQIGQAIINADLGVAGQMLQRRPLRTINQALTLIGHPRLESLEDVGRLRRAARALEGAGDEDEESLLAQEEE